MRSIVHPKTAAEIFKRSAGYCLSGALLLALAGSAGGALAGSNQKPSISDLLKPQGSILDLVQAVRNGSNKKPPANPPQPKGPLVVKEIGSFFAGGEKVFSENGHGTNRGVPGADDQDVPGTVTINQTYVKYIIPNQKSFPYPIVMLTGGGHTTKIFETTPDGREGWQTYFPRRGMATYLSDGVNRGASSWDIKEVALAAQGILPPSAIPPINKFTWENAWTGFRIGPSYGVQNPGNQFPVNAYEQYANGLVPTFRLDVEENAKNTRALIAVIDKIGPCVLLGWSQGADYAINAAVARPKLVKGFIVIDSGAGNRAAAALTPQQVASIARIPKLALDGDFRTAPTTTASLLGPNAENIWLPEIGIHGNGHTMAVEKNNLQVAEVILDWIKQKVR